MMLRPIRNALLALAVAPLAAAPAAATETYEAAFDFRIAGIRAGEISMGGVESGRTYEARAKVNTAGLVGIFADFRFDGTAAGGVAGDGRIVPQVFRASSVSPRAARETRIDWENGTPVFVSVKPERSTSPDPSNQTGTLDPVSASFALLRDVERAGHVHRAEQIAERLVVGLRGEADAPSVVLDERGLGGGRGHAFEPEKRRSAHMRRGAG